MLGEKQASEPKEGHFPSSEQELFCHGTECKHQHLGSENLNVDYLKSMFRSKIFPNYLNTGDLRVHDTHLLSCRPAKPDVLANWYAGGRTTTALCHMFLS